MTFDMKCDTNKKYEMRIQFFREKNLQSQSPSSCLD